MFFVHSGSVLDLKQGMPPTARPRGSADRRRPDRRALFLAEISRTLLDAPDGRESLTSVARLAMDELDAWCIVDVCDDEGAIERLAVIHPDKSLQPLATELEQHYPPMPDDALGAPRVVITQQPELVADVSEAMITAASRDERHHRVLQALGMGSYMVVPIKARDRLLGSITFVSAREGLKYTPRDLLFTEDLAGRAGMAMDYVRLCDEAVQARAEAVESAARAAVADRAKTDFLATMSHELRTPLNAIGGYAELLELGMRGPVSDQQREAIARIRRSQQHLLGIVNDILTFAKTETGRIPLTIESIDVDHAMSSVYFLVEPMLAASELRYSCKPCNNSIAVRADRDRLQQILVNLLSNAAKFSFPHSSVSVSTESREHLVAMLVADEGEGVAEEMQDAIFEPFVQASTGLTRTSDGNGLGLSISRELARLMGGDITVTSELGKGSTFTLTLPVALPAQPLS